MAPKPGGVLAALTNADDADVVFVAHTGVEHMTTVLDVWRELPMDREIQMRWWIVPADEVPHDREARIDWLFAWWATIDDWINARQAEVARSGAAAVTPCGSARWARRAAPLPSAQEDPVHRSGCPESPCRSPSALPLPLPWSALPPFPARRRPRPRQASFPVQLVRVDTPRAADKSRLTNLGLDLTEHAGPGFVEVVLHTAADAATLRDAGLAYDVEIPDLALRTAQNNKISTAYAALRARPRRCRAAATPTAPWPTTTTTWPRWRPSSPTWSTASRFRTGRWKAARSTGSRSPTRSPPATASRCC